MTFAKSTCPWRKYWCAKPASWEAIEDYASHDSSDSVDLDDGEAPLQYRQCNHLGISAPSKFPSIHHPWRFPWDSVGTAGSAGVWQQTVRKSAPAHPDLMRGVSSQLDPTPLWSMTWFRYSGRKLNWRYVLISYVCHCWVQLHPTLNYSSQHCRRLQLGNIFLVIFINFCQRIFEIWGHYRLQKKMFLNDRSRTKAWMNWK